MRFENDKGALVFYHRGEHVRIEAWGRDSFRVRASMLPEFTGNNRALTEETAGCDTQVKIEEEDHWAGDGTVEKKEIATITNGRLRAVVNFVGIISFYRDGQAHPAGILPEPRRNPVRGKQVYEGRQP